MQINFQLDIPMYWNDSRITLDTDAFGIDNMRRWYYIDPDLKEDIWYEKYSKKYKHIFKLFVFVGFLVC